MNPLDSNPESKLPDSGDPPLSPLFEAPAPSGEPTAPAPEPRPEPILIKDLLKKEKEKDREKDKERDKEKEKEREKEKSRDKDKKKKKKKEFKKADPWQRYKALHDSLKESQDLVDLADHKARFALIIMGALNAAIIILSTRSDVFSSLPANLKLWLYVYFAVYTVIAIYFLVQAIESLRPRPIPNVTPRNEVPDKAENLGLRFFVDALRYELPTYLSAWQDVRVSQLNTELATQLHALARINHAKYNAVAKLYLGLQAITVLTAGLLVALGVAAWVEHRVTTPIVDEAAVSDPIKIKAGKPKKGGWAILGEPARFDATGVKEPSGIAFSPARGSLFVVGDEGSLVEFDSTGKPVKTIPITGNLEDVAVHTPSGRLVLLSEKKGQLLVVDPETGQTTGKFKLDSEAVLGEPSGDRNQGFEGLAFRPDPTKPGGGVFYLSHQRTPALIVAFTFDPLAASGRVGAESVIQRMRIPNREDLTAITYDAGTDRMFVISDTKDRVALLNPTLVEEAEIVLPGVQQEGIAFDAAGNLWIADDRAGLLMFSGARPKIIHEMKAPDKEPAGDDASASKPS
jgi:uncharacterized protein YjiK